MTDYVQNYMKGVDLDNVHQTKGDDNVHQNKGGNIMKGRCISKMELMPLLLGEKSMIPEKMHHIRYLSIAELHIAFSIFERMPSRAELNVMITILFN
jgi:hypothetical protein